MSPSHLADLVLVAHAGVVVFVVGGLAAILFGNTLCCWAWVNQHGFRWLHAAAILVVVVQAWLGKLCPLTVLEFWLRTEAGERGGAPVSFIAYWLHRLLYIDAPFWAFSVAYTFFGLLVAFAWWRFPPQPLRTHL